MADIDVVEKQSRGRGAGSGIPTLVWAAIAILAVGALLTWLAVASNRTAPAVVREDEAADTRRVAAAPEEGVEPAVFAEVAAAPDPFIGRRLQIEGVEVAATLGPNAFWGDVPGANPFLVLVAPEVAAVPQLDAGTRFDIQGVVNLVTDSLVNVWAESGAIRPGARDEAAFATHYLLAERINE
jgi:hypothetical protein